MMRYSLFGYIFHAKTTLGILNISLSISIAHLLIDILKFSFTIQCTFEKIIERKKFFQVGLELTHLQCEIYE